MTEKNIRQDTTILMPFDKKRKKEEALASDREDIRELEELEKKLIENKDQTK